MRISERFFVIFVLTSLLVATPVPAQKQLAQSPRILSAKSVYFNNQTGFDAVGKNALAQLKKWGKFRTIYTANAFAWAFRVDSRRLESVSFHA
jgi:hypothetical protein